jgi:hypothetical protein
MASHISCTEISDTTYSLARKADRHVRKVTLLYMWQQSTGEASLLLETTRGLCDHPLGMMKTGHILSEELDYLLHPHLRMGLTGQKGDPRNFGCLSWDMPEDG